MSVAEIDRQQAGTPGGAGGQFAPKRNAAPLDRLGPLRPRTIVRATAGDMQVIYERDEGSEHLKVTVLMLDEEAGPSAWVEEGAVLTATPADSDPDRISAVAAAQVSALVADTDESGDAHEAIDAFLARIADQRDPAITRAAH